MYSRGQKTGLRLKSGCGTGIAFKFPMVYIWATKSTPVTDTGASQGSISVMMKVELRVAGLTSPTEPSIVTSYYPGAYIMLR